jgi:subtilisin family serine protease
MSTPTHATCHSPRPWRSLATVAACLVAAASLSGAAHASPIASHSEASHGYIVVLKNAPDLKLKPMSSQAAAFSARYGGRVTHVYQRALSGYAAQMTSTQARLLAADPRVARVEPSKTFRATAAPASWGLDRVDQRDLPLDQSYSVAEKASNVTAYIIDTGIRTTHQDFGGRATSGIDAVDNDEDATDCNGHGTHVAGTVGGSEYGIAKGVKLTAVRVLDCEGSGSTEQVIAGIDWVTQHAQKPAVANMSLGGGLSESLDEAVQRSVASGVTYAVAAGNSNADACQESPARVPEVLTVGASDEADARTSFSNFGTCVDVFAPGMNITSAWAESDTATEVLPGTSMASPHVAGAAALYLAGHPEAAPQEVQAGIVEKATADKVTNAGTGSPTKLLFVE